jgi:hypothetical protein
MRPAKPKPSRLPKDKESYRLWFEFLRRAYKTPGLAVDGDVYGCWGDVAGTSFDTWWRDGGRELLVPRTRVSLIDKDALPQQHIGIAVPLSLTPTQAANELRALLIQHYAETGHVPKPARRFTLTEGAEIKVAAFRAYLHTYDAYLRILERGADKAATNRTGKRDKSGRTIDGSALPVSGKEMLGEVRRFYLARTERWRHTRRTVEGLPLALAHGMTVNPVTGQTVNYAGDESAALRTVKRYFVSAQRLVQNAAKGEFPGDY